MKVSIAVLTGFLVSAASFSAPCKHVGFQQNTKISSAAGRLAPRLFSLKAIQMTSTDTARTVPGSYQDDIKFVVQSMLKNSQFVYNFATLRNIVTEYDRLIREGVPPKKGSLVDFVRPELIVTQRGAQEDNMNRYLKYPITSAAILEFIKENRKLLDDSEGDVRLGENPNETPLRMEELLEQQAKYDGDILDYDDQFTSAEGLVYGLTVNRSKKRVTVLFRGTVGLKDIFTDANFFMGTPDVFKDCEEDIKTHKGFSSYLFNEIPEEGRSKFDRIVAAIKEVYDELPVSENEKDEYELFVTGHSLGGGLANLFAFAVAKTQNHYKFFDRVTAVTFAAPVVGSKAYNEAFQALEKEGILRQIRISSQGDVVTTQPVPGYTQNGVNLHLYADKDVVLDYRNNKILNPLWLANVGLFGKPSVLDIHMFPEYEKRILVPGNAKIFKKSIEELYEETAVKNGFAG